MAPPALPPELPLKVQLVKSAEQMLPCNEIAPPKLPLKVQPSALRIPSFKAIAPPWPAVLPLKVQLVKSTELFAAMFMAPPEWETSPSFKVRPLNISLPEERENTLQVLLPLIVIWWAPPSMVKSFPMLISEERLMVPPARLGSKVIVSRQKHLR